MKIHINEQEHEIDVDNRTSLLDLLREYVALTGTKKGCNQGACGACTVLADGERINSCMALAVQFAGRSITTIEGLGSAESPHPLQAAFIAHDGFQCGYCTPGRSARRSHEQEIAQGVPSANTQNLGEHPIRLTSAELRERMSGNLCRCGAYNGIVDAILETFGEKVAS